MPSEVINARRRAQTAWIVLLLWLMFGFCQLGVKEVQVLDQRIALHGNDILVGIGGLKLNIPKKFLDFGVLIFSFYALVNFLAKITTNRLRIWNIHTEHRYKEIKATIVDFRAELKQKNPKIKITVGYFHSIWLWCAAVFEFSMFYFPVGMNLVLSLFYIYAVFQPGYCS